MTVRPDANVVQAGILSPPSALVPPLNRLIYSTNTYAM
ncbi:hypothetical protein TNCV_4239761, partial [Trichonephila clavipes]